MEAHSRNATEAPWTIGCWRKEDTAEVGEQVRRWQSSQVAQLTGHLKWNQPGQPSSCKNTDGYRNPSSHWLPQSFLWKPLPWTSFQNTSFSFFPNSGRKWISQLARLINERYMRGTWEVHKMCVTHSQDFFLCSIGSNGCGYELTAENEMAKVLIFIQTSVQYMKCHWLLVLWHLWKDVHFSPSVKAEWSVDQFESNTLLILLCKTHTF